MIIDNHLWLGTHSSETIVSAATAAALNKQAIRLAGLTHVHDEYVCQRARPTHHTVVITLEGHGELVLAKDGDEEGNTEEWEASCSASAWLLPAGRSFRYSNQHKQPWYFAWFILEDCPSWQHCQQHEVECLVDDSEFIEHSLALLQKPLSTELQNALSEAVIEQIHDLLKEQTDGRQSPKDEATLKRLHHLFNHTQKHLHQPWSVESLAAHTHISPQSLYRWSQKHYHASPMKIVAQQRLIRAQELLRQTEWPLHAVAQHVGYSDGFSLSKAYKKHFGHSPRTHEC